MLRRTLIPMVAILLVASSAYAGVILKSESKIYGSQRINAKTTLYLERDRMRMETTDDTGEKEVVIFRKDKQLFWVIDPKKGTYTEITKAQLRQMKRQMDEYKKEMEAAMKNMPPEQRAMVEQMMKGQMPSAQPQEPEINYRRGGSGKVGLWYCTKYQGFSKGSKVEEVWVTPFDKLGITPSDLKILNQMGNFFDEFYLGSGNSIVGDTEKWKNTFKGFPVKTTSYKHGNVVYEDHLEEVKKTRLSQTLFELARGLRKNTLIPREK
jgi:hypothetical protein